MDCLGLAYTQREHVEWPLKELNTHTDTHTHRGMKMMIVVMMTLKSNRWFAGTRSIWLRITVVSWCDQGTLAAEYFSTVLSCNL